MNGLEYVFHLFNKGGFVMYPLLLCSFLAIGIAFERYFYYQKNTFNYSKLNENLNAALNDRDWFKALSFCDEMDTIFSRVAKTGLIHGGRKDINTLIVKESFDEQMSVEIVGLKKYMDYLSAIVTLAPLLGLLGTVIGMIATFNVMDSSGGGAEAITGGVGEALVATATGLCVAVIAFIIHTYYSHRFEDIMKDAESLCYRILQYKRRAEI